MPQPHPDAHPDDRTPPGGDALPEGRLTGRRRFESVIRQVVEVAAREGWPSLRLSDPDFRDWPLGERAVIEALDAWAGRGRQLCLLAHGYDALRLAHPRLVTWRTRWSHIVDARACAPGRGGELPSAVIGPAWTLQRLDPQGGVFVATSQAQRRVQLKERWDACWEQGQPSFAATTLGL